MRTKPPKEILERREKDHKAPKELVQIESRFDWKFWMGLAIGLAGLILAALGMQARPTVSLESPLNPADVLSTPIVISNDGWLPLNDVRVVSYFRRIEYDNNVQMADLAGADYAPPTAKLGVGERATVPLFQFFKVGRSPLIRADLALVIYFRPSYLWFWSKRRAFRFVTVSQADGSFRLQQQASEDTLERYDKHFANETVEP